MFLFAKCIALLSFLFLLCLYLDIESIRQHLKYSPRRRFHVTSQSEASLKSQSRAITNANSLTSQHDNMKVGKKTVKGNTLDLYWVEHPEHQTVSPVSKNSINYADEMLGAYIENFDAILARPRILLDWFGFINEDNAPEELIRDNMQPGACFAFKQSHEAIITIMLAESIFIDALELQHISKYVSPSKSTENAPRHFSVYAISALEDVNETHLGDFEFENIAPYQVFPASTIKPYQKIRVHFTSNHGHPEVTCVYKLAVYGRLPNGIEDFNEADILM